MFQTEYLRNLNANYERICLENKPEENRYQYCILNRGGIRGLLPCTLRYMNGKAYLYYDISSKQNAAQRFGNRCIGRDWVRDLLWSMEQIRQELGRFLLDIKNVVWYPDQIFQDLESNSFYFLYFPYYEGENSFVRLLEFLVDHIDYNDEILADCVYHIYERLENVGETYLQEQIFEDAKALERTIEQNADSGPKEKETVPEERPDEDEKSILTRRREERKGLRGLFDSRRHREREPRDNYSAEMQRAMDGYAVAEESLYEEEEFGRTVYIEEKHEETERVRKLYTADDRLAAALEKSVVTLGKKKEEADIVLGDASVSRLHARITREGKEYYLEDLNSTNGTFKNGLRLQPYEKRKLEAGDELKCGRVVLNFR